MTTKLEGALKRELNLNGKTYTLKITPEGFNLAPKGRRRGHALAWADLVSGDAALATALNASLAHAPKPDAVTARATPAKGTARKAKRPAGK